MGHSRNTNHSKTGRSMDGKYSQKSIKNDNLAEFHAHNNC
jgi:hypothetical protein